MYVKTKLGAILVAASTLSVALPNGRRNNDPAKKAVYFLQNNPAGASVIALDLVDGHIADPVRTSTQGIGVGAVNMTSGEAANIDTLNSQSAVTVGGSYLFAVNAGSNTLATFNIDEADPVHPQLIGQPTDTLGDFPVSVTYSDELNTGMELIISGCLQRLTLRSLCPQRRQGQQCSLLDHQRLCSPSERRRPPTWNRLPPYSAHLA